jgi:hypothetical protein
MHGLAITVAWISCVELVGRVTVLFRGSTNQTAGSFVASMLWRVPLVRSVKRMRPRVARSSFAIPRPLLPMRLKVTELGGWLNVKIEGVVVE